MPAVAVFSKTLLPYSETFIKEQAKALRDWSPVLVGYQRDRSLSLDNLSSATVEDYLPSFARDLGRRCLQAFNRFPRGLTDNLMRTPVDLVHAHFGPNGVSAWPLAKRIGVPLLVTLHGADINIHKEWWHSAQGGRRMKAYPERLLTLGANGIRFIAVSEAIRQRAVEFGLPAENIFVRHIGIDTNRFAPAGRQIADREKIVLFVGRLVEKKGTAYLLESLHAIRRDVAGLKLIVVGDGPLRDSLQTRARQLGLDVEFKRALSHEHVKGLLDRARVLCLPSIRAGNGDAEGMGMVILEAQACGVPVVTSALGGATEGIDHGHTGFAFPEKDTQTMAEQLRLLLTDDTLASSMSANARAWVASRFEIRECTRQLEAVYSMVARKQIPC